MENKFHEFVDEISELQTAFIDSVIRVADSYKYDRDMLLQEAVGNLTDIINDPPTFKDYTPAETDAEENFDKRITILINRAAFSETQEMLNAEIDKVLDILKKSPMFTGRITLAMEISNRGKNVRPILYKTKYVPKEGIIEPQIDGQFAITDYP